MNIEESLVYEVCIAVLALIFNDTKGKKPMMDFIENEIGDETTCTFLKKVEKKYFKLIEDLSEKTDSDTLKATVLFSDPTRFTEVDMYSTPKGISNLAIAILDLVKGDSVLDMGSGVNSFLIQAALEADNQKFYGVEINTSAVVIANIRGFVAERVIEITQGNIISQNFTDLSANKVFSNHPLGMRLPNLQNLMNNNPMLNKFFKKAKRTVSGDWIFNMAAYLNMKQPGKTVALMTNAGTWNKPDEELRKLLIEKGIIEGVILLPKRLLSTTMIPLTMMILSQNNKSIRMVDASEIFTEGRRQNSLESDDLLKIVEAYNNDTNISRKVSIMEIEEQEYILNPQRYIGFDVGIEDGISFGEISISIKRGAMIKSTELDDVTSIEETNKHYLMLQNIKDGIVDSSLPSLTSIENKYAKYCINNKDLIISKLYPFKVAILQKKENEQILANGNLYFIELDKDKVNPVFVEVFMRSEIGIAQLNRYAKGSAMKSISIKDLKNIQIPNLPRQEQDRIAKEYENLCDELIILQKQSDMIRDKKAKLLEGVI
jgi:type I restriction enzyme M protein